MESKPFKLKEMTTKQKQVVQYVWSLAVISGFLFFSPGSHQAPENEKIMCRGGFCRTRVAAYMEEKESG
jgi:hypothetical protein